MKKTSVLLVVLLISLVITLLTQPKETKNQIDISNIKSENISAFSSDPWLVLAQFEKYEQYFDRWHSVKSDIMEETSTKN